MNLCRLINLDRVEKYMQRWRIVEIDGNKIDLMLGMLIVLQIGIFACWTSVDKRPTINTHRMQSIFASTEVSTIIFSFSPILLIFDACSLLRMNKIRLLLPWNRLTSREKAILLAIEETCFNSKRSSKKYLQTTCSLCFASSIQVTGWLESGTIQFFSFVPYKMQGMQYTGRQRIDLINW